MELILGLFKDLGLWAAILAIIFAYWLFILGGLHEEGNRARERWIDVLEERDFYAHYRDNIMRGVDYLDRRLTPEAFGNDPRYCVEKNNLRTAFSFRLLNITLALALLYPIVGLMLQWAVSGVDAAVGGLIVIPAEDNRLTRGTTIGILVIEVCLFVSGAYAAFRGKKTNLALLSSAILGLVLALSYFCQSESQFKFASLVALVVMTSFAFAIITNLFYVIHQGFTLPFTKAFANSFAYSFGLAINGKGAFVVATTFALSTINSGVAIHTAAAIAIGSLLAITFTGEKRGAHAQWLFWYAVVGLAAIYSSVIMSSKVTPTSSGESPAGVILFIGLLPLLNGLLDFLSAGATRYLIRIGRSNPLWWLLDAVIAAITLTLLAALFIAFVIFAVPQNNVPLLDLPLLFHDVRTNPGDYWWLSFMLFSTLLPTLLHAIIALSSIHTFAPKSWRLWIAGEIAETKDIARARRGKLALAALNSFAYWFPTFVVIYVGLWIWTVDNGLRDLAVDGAEMLAMYLSDLRNGPGAYVPIPVRDPNSLADIM